MMMYYITFVDADIPTAAFVGALVAMVVLVVALAINEMVTKSDDEK